MPEANAETFADGWCKTGDLGRVDGEGFLTLAERSKEMIRSGSENVYPAEVEKVITAHEDVGDAAIIGGPDPKYFEVGAAVLIPASGRTSTSATCVSTAWPG
jgi:fatty-acyl-CoA synthase